MFYAPVTFLLVCTHQEATTRSCQTSLQRTLRQPPLHLQQELRKCLCYSRVIDQANQAAACQSRYQHLARVLKHKSILISRNFTVFNDIVSQIPLVGLRSYILGSWQRSSGQKLTRNRVKKNGIYHHSQKENLKISKKDKFGNIVITCRYGEYGFAKFANSVYICITHYYYA